MHFRPDPHLLNDLRRCGCPVEPPETNRIVGEQVELYWPNVICEHFGGVTFCTGVSLQVREEVTIVASSISIESSEMGVEWIDAERTRNGPMFVVPGRGKTLIEADNVLNRFLISKRALRRGRVLEGMIIGTSIMPFPTGWRHHQLLSVHINFSDSLGGCSAVPAELNADRSLMKRLQATSSPHRRASVFTSESDLIIEATEPCVRTEDLRTSIASTEYGEQKGQTQGHNTE
jgi:hypothetical protein